MNTTDFHGEYTSEMSQDQIWPGPVAFSTGFALRARLFWALVGTVGRNIWSSISAAIRHQVRREASITPLSQAVAKEWSTETCSAQPSLMYSLIRSRSASLIRLS
ncbi:hypothetical protein [Paeniglutamicibacter cryotolerans]|uniref:Uncharacterized protein n=1 Tax=Paeniglutamicibacter cryotolerans TaxID=670079 RepID=A0A839QUL9_9MICC|nr:hypothetical protein [Paeniglutamicibacter cryotolerans]MBB2997656.1 hypothetical protein [Paeniglutamicibacter cryotolerans]